MTTKPTRAPLPLILDDTYVRQDDQGRYSLNDLHQAAGGEGRNEPHNFMRLDTTKALIAEISSPDMRTLPTATVLGKGKQQGTYVVRELVYAYAMWISPAFHLKVIRTFDALVTGKLGAASQANALVGKATGLPLAQLTGLHKHSWELIDRLKQETAPEIRALYYRQLQAACADLAQEPPALDTLGSEAPAQPAAATEFWVAYHALQGAGVRVNHSHNAHVIAVNLKQFAQVAEAHGMRLAKGMALKDALRQSLDPRFLSITSVNSAVHGSSIHCWTFQANALLGDAS